MIVELIGCTGAGKTSLGRSLEARALEGGGQMRVRMMYDLALDHGVLRHIAHPSLANLVQDAAALPFALASLRRRRDFFVFAASVIKQRFPARIDRVNRLRGVVRRVGMYEFARTVADRDVVLSDEGTLLLAYLYALTDLPYTQTDLETFAELAPLPDLVVYVRATPGVLVARARRRSDRQRHLGAKRPFELERLLARTDEVFDRLVTTGALEGRVLAVDNSSEDDAHDALDAVATLLSDRRRALAHAQPPSVTSAPGPL